MLHFFRSKKFVSVFLTSYFLAVLWGVTLPERAFADTLPTGARIFWPGTNATIPSGWTEDTAFADRYLQGDDETYTAPANGGATGHVHVTPAKTPVGNSHQHTLSAGASTGETTTTIPSGTGSGDPEGSGHTHPGFSSNSSTITYSSVNPPDLGSATMRPTSFRVIVLQPDDASQDIPDGAWALTDESSVPTGFNIADGNNGTTNAGTSFLIGATSGGDGGAFVGSDTHTHTASGTFAPTASAHAHTKKTTPDPTIGSARGGGIVVEVEEKHHDAGVSSTASGSVNSASLTVNSTSSEPAFQKVLPIENTSGAATTPDNVIVAYVGDATALPSGNWELCDGTGSTPDLRDVQIKVDPDTGDIGSTGGSNTHVHVLDDITFTHSGSHQGSINASFTTSANTAVGLGFNVTILIDDAHSHTWTVAATTPTLQATTFTADSSDGRYTYRTVVFIKLIGEEAPATRRVIMIMLITFELPWSKL